MESWANKKSFHRNAAESMLESSLDESVQDIQLSSEISEWLGKLSLLYGVPLEYLVPDNRMLPLESIRFFYIDRNWIDRLVDGALSVGVLSTKDQVFNKAFFKQIYNAVDVAQLQTRDIIRGKKIVAPKSIGGTITGLLIRSKVVSDYPGLEIVGTSARGKKLEIIRMDRLSDTMILCLFNGYPSEVNFEQPAEGLHFGIPFFYPEDGAKHSSILLRGLGYNNYEAGVQIDCDGEKLKADVPFTGTAKGVIDFSKLAKNITGQFKSLSKNPLGPNKDVTSGSFALQMVVTKQVQSYKIKNKQGKPPKGCGIK